MDVEPRKEALRYFFTRVVEPMGYKFSPDEEIVDFLLEQEVGLEQEHGMPYCPCQGRSEDRAADIAIVCPCIPFHRAHYDSMKRCWCGLFVHQDVTDPDSLPQIPENVFLEMQGGGR
jgi:ferredoxin-thioredoxin reductase catalytic chain